MHCPSLISVQSTIDTLRHLLISLDITTPSQVRAVHGAKVPILKFRTTPALGNFAIDISFNLDNGPAGAREQLRLLQEIGPSTAERVSCLVVTLKAFLTAKGLMEVRDGGIGGLTLFCMIVAFFQVSQSSALRSQLIDGAVTIASRVGLVSGFLLCWNRFYGFLAVLSVGNVYPRNLYYL